MSRSLNVPVLSRPLCAAVLAGVLVVVMPGCGGDGGGGSDAPADDAETVEAVKKKIDVAAHRVIRTVRDKNLPGPYYFKHVCLSPEDALSFGTPNESVQCHIEAFTVPNDERGSAYVWSEDWRVPVQDGTLGEPEIVGKYRIRDFLRKDNRLNCSGGETPQERCTGVYQTQAPSAVPGGATGGQPPVPGQP